MIDPTGHTVDYTRTVPEGFEIKESESEEFEEDWAEDLAKVEERLIELENDVDVRIAQMILRIEALEKLAQGFMEKLAESL